MFIKVKDDYKQEYYINFDKIGAIFDNAIFLLGDQDRYEISKECQEKLIKHLHIHKHIIE